MRVDSCGRGEVGERRVYQIVGMTHGETERGGIPCNEGPTSLTDQTSKVSPAMSPANCSFQ